MKSFFSLFFDVFMVVVVVTESVLLVSISASFISINFRCCCLS